MRRLACSSATGRKWCAMDQCRASLFRKQHCDVGEGLDLAAGPPRCARSTSGITPSIATSASSIERAEASANRPGCSRSSFAARTVARNLNERDSAAHHPLAAALSAAFCPRPLTAPRRRGEAEASQRLVQSVGAYDPSYGALPRHHSRRYGSNTAPEISLGVPKNLEGECMSLLAEVMPFLSAAGLALFVGALL